MGSQTPAGNYAYHINDLDQLTSSRINNAVKFQSANFAGLTFGAMYGFSNSTQFAGTPTTTGANGSQGSSSAYSFGANYAQGRSASAPRTRTSVSRTARNPRSA